MALALDPPNPRSSGGPHTKPHRGRAVTGLALVRPLRAIAWELRTAWAIGRRVSLILERADTDRVEGHVQAVAATDATVTVSGLLVPLDRVLAVHLPSRLGDSNAGRLFHGRPRAPEQIPGQMEWPLSPPDSGSTASIGGTSAGTTGAGPAARP